MESFHSKIHQKQDRYFAQPDNPHKWLQEFCIAKRNWPAHLASSTQRKMIVNIRFPTSHSVHRWQHRQWDNGHARFTTDDPKWNRRQVTFDV